MRKILKQLKKSDFFKSVLSVGTGNICGQLLAVITVPIISRLYSQEAYGEYGLLLSTASIVTSFATLGLTSAIMHPETDEEGNEVFLTACVMQALVSAIIFFGALFGYSKVRLFEISESYFLALILLIVYIICVNVRSLMYTYINRLGMNNVLLLNPIIRAVVIFAVSVPLGLLHFNYIGLLLANILAEAITAFQMMRKVNPFKVSFSIKTLRNTLKKYKKYVLMQCPANAIGSLGRQFPTQFISRMFGNFALGSYSMCIKVLNYPIALLAAPISTVYFRTASRYQREGKDLATFTLKLVIGAMIVAIVPLLVVVLWGENIFAFVLGNQWKEAGEIASIVIYEYILWFCCQCTSYCRVAIGRQEINLIYSIVDIFITLAFCFIGYFGTGNLIGTICAFTIGKCVVNIIDMSLNFICMKKHIFKYFVFIVAYSILVIFLMKVF